MLAIMRHTSFLERTVFSFLLIALLPGLLAAQKLEVKGTLKKDGNAFKEDAKILLYERNEVVGKAEPDWLSSFSFKLSLNSHYTVEVRADGYITKRVSFDTSIPEDVEEPDPSKFEFDVMMLRKRRVSPEEKGVFDFPVGRVFFDPYEKEFRFNTSYTTRIRREFRKALNKNDDDLGKVKEEVKEKK